MRNAVARKSSLTPYVLLALAGCAQEGERLRVMTFNIRYGTAADGEDHWQMRGARVIASIRGHAPDILGTQEVLPFQASELQAALPEFVAHGRGRDADGGGEACTLFVRKDRLKVEEHGTFWLAPDREVPGAVGWDAALTRICTWARVRDRRSGARLVVANVHFDHRGERARLESARLLQRWTEQRALPLILLGDFNATETAPPLRALEAAGFRDCYGEVHPDRSGEGTFNGFDSQGSKRIDHILCTEGFALHSAIIDNGRIEGRFPSDHHPVLVELSLPARAEIDVLADTIR